jgi:hypothetical protein
MLRRALGADLDAAGECNKLGIVQLPEDVVAAL